MTADQQSTAREVVEQLFTGLRTPDADAFANALAPDAVFEIPFTVPGMPTRLEGREAIREHLAQRWSGRSGIQVHEVHPEVYPTSDPELFFVENDVDMTGPDGVRRRGRTSVNAVRVRDGQITLFRDYMDTARLAALTER